MKISITMIIKGGSKMNEFTLGVEEEFMVIDPVSRELKSHEQKIVDAAQKIMEDQVNSFIAPVFIIF